MAVFYSRIVPLKVLFFSARAFSSFSAVFPSTATEGVQGISGSEFMCEDKKTPQKKLNKTSSFKQLLAHSPQTNDFILG